VKTLHHNPRRHLGSLVLLCATLVFIPQAGRAQWRTQTIQLHPGWNAVYFEVQPEPDDCDTIFANLPIENIWKWNRRFSSIQFVTDPSRLLPEDPDWLVWFPLTDKQAFLRRLRSIEANQSYLIKLADDSGPVTLAIKGRVELPNLEWFPHGLNLVGFPVNPVNPPTFADFFKFTTEVVCRRTRLAGSCASWALADSHGERPGQHGVLRFQPQVGSAGRLW
jgi:hypothetical protein